MPRDRQGRRIVDCEDKEVIGWLNSWSVDRSGAWVKEEVINWSESRVWIKKWMVGRGTLHGLDHKNKRTSSFKPYW